MDYSHNIAYNKQQYSINEVYNTKEGMKDTEIDIKIEQRWKLLKSQIQINF